MTYEFLIRFRIQYIEETIVEYACLNDKLNIIRD